MSRQALNNMQGRDLAWDGIRLDKAFGGSPESWLYLQSAYDLVQGKKTPALLPCDATLCHKAPDRSLDYSDAPASNKFKGK